MIKDFILFCWAGIISVIYWFMGDFDGLLKFLLVLSVMDYFSGLSVGWIEHNISSSVGFKGIIKKVYMFALVGIANLIDQNILIEHACMKFGVSIFFISNEGISILENANKLGIPIPKILIDHFSDLKKNKGLEQKKEQCKDSN